MEAEWQETTIGDQVDLATGEAFESARFGTTPDSGTLLARGDNIKEGEFEWGDKARYWPELTPNLERRLLRDGDVLLGMDGSKVGKNWVQVREKDLPCLLVQRVACLRAKKSMDQQFLRYLIGNPDFAAYVERVKTGTSIPHISGGQIKAYQILLPSRAEQRTIAHILGSLDDKIELNRRMNETLEAMARALFKSWFIDFDPVHAKAEGRDAGLPADIAALFPDSFQDSDLGEIPEGWRIGTLEDYAELNPESWSADTVPDEVNYVDLANTKWGRIEVPQRLSWKEAPSRARRVLRPGDTIVGTVRPGNGSYSFVAEDGLTGSTGFAVLRPRAAAYAALVYLAATEHDNIVRLAHLADGAAYPAVRPEVVFETQVVRPDRPIVECFARCTRYMMERQAANNAESRTLTSLRDSLLPKLLSGEVHVKDVECVKDVSS